MNFAAAVAEIGEIEGGYVDHPQDRGGPTKFGISQASYPHLDIRNLTEDVAREIYRRDFWDRVGCDLLPAELRLAVFDSAVNQGVSPAVRLLQGVVGVPEDGALGPKTLAAIAGWAPWEVLAYYLAARAMRYVRTDTFETFGVGWMRRLFKVAIRTVLLLKGGT